MTIFIYLKNKDFDTASARGSFREVIGVFGGTLQSADWGQSSLVAPYNSDAIVLTFPQEELNAICHALKHFGISPQNPPAPRIPAEVGFSF